MSIHDLHIREASLEDAATIAALHVASKTAGYAPFMTQEYLATLTQEEFTKSWTQWLNDSTKVLICEDAGSDGGSSSGSASGNADQDDRSDTVSGIISNTGKTALGFIAFGPIRTRLKEDRGIMPAWPGEVYALYVHPDAWGMGAAQALMQQAKDPMRKHYWDKALLWVIDKNQRAVKFYEKMGGQRIGKQKVNIGGQDVSEIAFGWKDITKLG